MNHHINKALIFSSVMTGIAIGGVMLAFWAAPKDYPFAIKVVGGLWFAFLLFYQIVLKEESHREVIREVARQLKDAEEQYKSNPDKHEAAWHVAKLKMEAYMNRNIEQVDYVFRIVIFFICGGFILIGSGILLIYADPESKYTSTLIAVSGSISQFIAAIVLLLYRSTLKQANNFMAILERINAVGMAIQILDEIDDPNAKVRLKAQVKIAKDVIAMYAQIKY